MSTADGNTTFRERRTRRWAQSGRTFILHLEKNLSFTVRGSCSVSRWSVAGSCEIANKANANFWEFRPFDGLALSDDSDDEALWDPLLVPDAAKCMADLAAERTDSCRQCLEYAHTGWWGNHLGLGRT